MKCTAKFFLLLSILLALGSMVFADTVQIGSGTTTFSYLPIYTLYSYNYTQQIYTQQQINRAGAISAIRFFYTTGVISASKDWKIYMGHSTRTTFNSTSDWEAFSNLTMVYDGDVSPFLPAENNWMNIPLDTPFNYNNTSNLIIAVYEDTPNYSSTIGWRSFTSGSNTGIYFYSDSTTPSPQSPPTANAITSSLAQIQLVFPNTSAPLAPTLLFPANGDEVFTNAQLRWQPTYGAGDPLSYDLYFGTNPNPPLLASGITGTSYAPNMQGDTAYYWKVVANNAVGSSPPSPIWTFNTAPPGVIQIGNATTNTYRPFCTLYGYERSAALYTQAQIGTYGMITRLAWSVANTGTTTVPYKIWIKTTEDTSLTPQSWDSLISGAILVKEGNHVFNSTGWVNFILDVPFIYTTGNLLIGVQSDYGGSGTGGYPYIHFTAAGSMQHQTWSQDGSPSVNNGNVSANLPNIVMHITPPTGDPSFMVNPTSHNFGEVRVGSNKSRNFTITNVGGGELIINSITISGSPAFTLANLPTLPATLATVQNTSFTVTFAPTQLGVANATITITDNLGRRSTHTVQVNGTGAQYLIIGEGSTNLYLPVNAYYGYTYSQSIYLQSEISTPGQRIERIAYYWNGAGVGNLSNGWTIYMGHTTQSAFTATNGWIPLSDLVPVYSGQLNIPAVAGWIEVTLDEPFVYNNIENLVIAVHETTPSYDGSSQFFFSTTTPTNRSLRFYSDGINPSPSSPPEGSLVGGFANIKMYLANVPTGAVFSIRPGSHDFGDVRVGSSKSKAFTITNQGGSNLGINSITISGNAGFTLSNLPTLPISLGAVGSTTFTVNFSPVALGAATATITIVDDIGNRTSHTVQVSGTGAQFMIIGDGTTNLNLPVNAFYGYTYSQSIYLQSEIATQNQRIERLAYYWNGAGVGNLSNGWTIYMGHTAQNAFTSTSGWIPLNLLTPVYTGQPNIPATPGWIEVLLTNPFIYNNTDNLVIAVYENVPGYDGSSQYFHCTGTPTNRSLRFYSDGTNPDPAAPPAGTLISGFPNIKMFFGDIPTSPVLVCQPTTLNFGMCAQNVPSEPKTLMLMNHGLGTLNLVAANVSIVGADAAMFSVNTSNLPAALSPGQSVLLTLTFTPGSEGAKTATLRVVYNGLNHDVALLGNGLPLGTVTIGNGTAQSSFPFYSLYEDARTQMLFTIDELMAGGALPGQFIEHLAFNVQSFNTITLNNLMIRMKTTDAATLTGFDTDNESFTTCYVATQPINATGWFYFEMDEPFFWNGGENLLVDVSFDNTAWTGNSIVYATSAPGKTWVANMDGGSGATLTGGYAQENRPNTRFLFAGTPGDDPTCFISPATYNFGEVSIGGSKSKTFNIINIGGGNLGITNIHISGSNAMSLGTLPNLPVYLQSAQRLQIEVIYSPNILGVDNATITITDDQDTRHILGKSPLFALASTDQRSRDVHTITLTGNGVNDITIGNGNTLARMPMDFFYRASLYETVFTANEISNFVGMITGIKLYNNFFTDLSNMPVKIWLGSTTQNDLSAGWIPATQLTLAFDGAVNFPSGENIISITFPEPYLHLDGGNLVMMIKRPMDGQYYSSSDQFKCQNGESNRARNLYSDSIDHDPNNPDAGTTTGTYPKITFVVIPGGVGHINGTVLGPDSQPLQGVAVTLAGRTLTVQTNQQGFFAIPNQLPGNYSLTFSKHTYVTQTVNFALEEDETEVVNISLQFMPRVTVSGAILASDTGAGIAGASIRFTGYETFNATSIANGTFTIPNVFANQSYNYVISAQGYVSTTGILNLGGSNHNMGNITLAEIAYAPNRVLAELNPTYSAVNLSWNAPDPNAVEITESFEEAQFPPAGWTQVITNNGPANTLGVYPTWCSFGAINTGSGLVSPTEGTKQAGLWWVTSHQDEWLKTPSFNCPPDAYIVFDTFATYGSTNGDHYFVKISNNGGNTWTALWDASVLPAGNNHYQNPVTIDLSNYAGSEVILAFHADDPEDNAGLWYVWFIDNIYIGNMVQTISFAASDLIPGRTGKTTALSATASPNTELSRAPQTRYTDSGISAFTKPGKTYARALVGYKVWRLAAGQETNEATWLSITPETITTLNHVDNNWPNLPNGTYKWAVKAVYTANVTSAPAFSNAQVKEQLNGTVVGFVRRTNNQGIPGARVTCSNGTYATTNSAGAYSLMLPVGQYSFTATANGYHPNTQDEINVAPNQNTTLNFVMIPVANEDEVVPVVATALNGNFPNPFNPETTISYDLKDAAQVRLEVYNLKGQMVRSLVNDIQASGRYRIVFDGKDDKKLPLPSGVYFYRFSAGEYRKTQKMMLMQ